MERGQGEKTMWMEIFKCVDTHSLLKCRLVSRQWNEISIGILHQRSDAKITFHFEVAQFFQKRNANTDKEETSLKSFLMCLQKSQSCPFARFGFVCGDRSFGFDYGQFFNHEDWKGFLAAVDESSNNNKNPNQNDNPRIKMKSLEFQFNSKESFEILIGNLRDLLRKIPHLEEFGLDFSEMGFEQHPKVQLFPEIFENPVVPTQLSHLKTIHFNQSMTFQFPGILKDLLKVAVNLNKIYLYKSRYNFFTEIYDFLEPLGKFHLLKSFEIRINDNFTLQVKKRPGFTDALFKLQLEELELDVDSKLKEAHVSSVTTFLSGLFESNKNSLKKLWMRPEGFSCHVQFPRFKNLTDLKLDGTFSPRPGGFFPCGICSLDIFPAVRTLDLSMAYLPDGFPQLDSIPVFPRVRNLSLGNIRFTGDSIRILSLLCPNLKHLKIPRYSSSSSVAIYNFLPVGRAIWTHLKQLESLEFDIKVDSSRNDFLALDSGFTGISLENCQRLHEMVEAKNTMEKYGVPVDIPQAKLESMSEREHSSILDMTNLKTLKINPYSGEKLLKSMDFFRENLTWISEEYAFKFMPHLKPKPEPEPTEETESECEKIDDFLLSLVHTY